MNRIGIAEPRLRMRDRDTRVGGARGGAGADYASNRRPDMRIAEVIFEALGDARTVLHLDGPGGRYVPDDRLVTALDLVALQVSDASGRSFPNAVVLPFETGQFDASMATLPIEQGNGLDIESALDEMRRVTSGPVVLMTWDPGELSRFWLAAYAPEVIAIEAGRFPSVDQVVMMLGPGTRVVDVPIPRNCSDGFCEAYFGRPEMLLDPAVRRAIPAWNTVGDEVHRRFMAELGGDLARGEWDRYHGYLRGQREYRGSLRLIVRD